MSIQLDSKQFNLLIRHAEKTYPEECCGIILGTITHDTTRTLTSDRKLVLDIMPVQNIWNEELAKDLPQIVDIPSRSSQKERNFFIAPEDILHAQKEARNRKAIVLGFYHSHPDAPAIPSEFDRAIAWPDYSYLIISLTEEQFTDVKSWQLDRERKFQSENIEIVESKENT
ncbi:MAG: M67 family metallopeptidase [Cyanobacteria bacterium SBLK]|nr:M67 family metallopeptidase [Cyanobacteria bacterium SBLK]